MINATALEPIVTQEQLEQLTEALLFSDNSGVLYD